MKIRSLYALLSTTFLNLVLLTACMQQGSSPSAQDAIDSAKPVEIISEGVEIEVLSAERLDSYQTHYMMNYPPQGEQFIRIDAAINGTDNPELWGKLNLALGDTEGRYTPVHVRRVLVGDDYEYTADEDFNFRYQFFFSVPQTSDVRTLRLLIQEKQSLSLSELLNTSHSEPPVPRSTPATGEYSVVAGGSSNAALATHTTVSGGQYNTAAVAYATVGGGRENNASYLYATVSGGYGNLASGRESNVGGGSRNTALGDHAVIAGGIQNHANASDSVVTGGAYNIADEIYATVSGGTRNVASGTASVVSGGAGNEATGAQSSISGGLGNQATGNYSVVSGGHENLASGDYSVTLGGFNNLAGGDYSVALGHSSHVSADHPGAFLFADSLAYPFTSENANEFAVRATGGIRIVNAVDQNGDPTSAVVLLPGSGSWETLSSRDTKTHFESVRSDEILHRVIELPLYTWSYRGDPISALHIGPTAEDFRAQFRLGSSASTIATVDADGVALAAIQAAGRQIQSQQAQLSQQEQRLKQIEDDLLELQNEKSHLKSINILLILILLSQFALLILKPLFIANGCVPSPKGDRR